MRMRRIKMAEFPELGKHCEFESCQVLDFLPFLCNDCGKTFCVAHKESTLHSCHGTISVENKSQVITHVECSSVSKCSYLDCKNRELIPITCQLCNHEYCLKHRHQQDHDCEHLKKLETAESKTAILVKSILNPYRKCRGSKSDTKNESKPSRNKNATKINAQVNLMKLKLNATGEKTIPPTDRLFFNVTLPTSGTANSFFSKAWTVGRVIDYIAAQEKLTNLNNVSSAKVQEWTYMYEWIGKFRNEQTTVKDAQKIGRPVKCLSEMLIKKLWLKCQLTAFFEQDIHWLPE